MNYLLKKEEEVKGSIQNYFSNGFQHDVTFGMRKILLDWLFDVANNKNFMTETDFSRGLFFSCKYYRQMSHGQTGEKSKTPDVECSSFKDSW